MAESSFDRLSDEHLLRQHKKDHPKALAFADLDTPNEDHSKSNDERMLEYELEKLIDQVNESIRLRQGFYSNPEYRAILPLVNEVKSIQALRKEREKLLAEVERLPAAEEAVPKGEQLLKEVALAMEAKNTPEYVLSNLVSFFEARQRALPMQKYRLLFRWARHCCTSEIIARADTLLHSRLTHIDEDYEYCTSALERLRKLWKSMEGKPKKISVENLASKEANGEKGIDEPASLQVMDIRLWLNATAYHERIRRRLTRFTMKCQWMGIQKRWEFYRPVVDTYLQKGHNALPQGTGPKVSATIPLLATTEEETRSQLDDLINCFQLRISGERDTQEFAYSVNKRFAAVYNSQNASMKFMPYELALPRKGEKRREAEKSAAEAQQPDDMSTEATYMVHASWTKFERIQPRLSSQQIEQECFLNNHPGMADTPLKVENSFLNETSDIQFVLRRLREQADTHMDRANVKQKVAEEIKSAQPPSAAVGGSGRHQEAAKTAKAPSPEAPTHNRHALYLLRYIRIREFKRRLLDILNYFASIRRRITIDSYGYVLPCDLEEGGKAPRSSMLYEGKLADRPVVWGYPLQEANSVAPEATEACGGVDSFTTRILRFSATPADFAKCPDPYDEGAAGSAAMQELQRAASIQNRDDTYHIVGKSIVVKDRFGQTIMYDVALKDLEDLEDELILIGTHYIKAHNSKASPHLPDVDRVSLLEDLFECETWFQDGKRKVLDCYIEAYEHVSTPAEQQKMAQVIIDLLAQRPLMDLSEPHFTTSYSSAIIALELQHSLLREIINSQVTEEKRAAASIHRGQRTCWWSLMGLPERPTSDTRLFQALFPGSSIVNVLDFYSSLEAISHIPELVDGLEGSFIKRFDVKTTLGLHCLRQHILQAMLIEWKLLTEEERVQRQLQTAMVSNDVDDRCMLDDIEAVERVVADISNEGLQTRDTAKKSKSQDVTESPLYLSTWMDVMEAALTRTTLMHALFETEVLANIHRKQGMIMGVNVKRFHFESMDFETRRTYAEVDEIELDETDMNEVVAIRTEYLSNLAVAEFEQSMAQFDFHSFAGLKRILSFGIADLRRAHAVQLVQKNLLATTALYNAVPIDHYFEGLVHEKATAQGTTFVTQKTDDTGDPSAESRRPPLFQQWEVDGHMSRDQLQRLFLSVNQIKSVHRRCILEELNHRTADILQSKRPELLRKRMKELKHNLIAEYCHSVMLAIYPYSLRYQIATLSHEIKRRAHALPGFEKGTILTFGQARDTLKQVATVASQIKQRGREGQHGPSGGQGVTAATGEECMIARDGRLEDPWYIPHFYQVYTQCDWDGHRDSRRADMRGSGAPRVHDHCHTSDGGHVRSLFCLGNMHAILHHVLGILCLSTCVSKLSVSASAAMDKRSGLESVAKDFRRLQADMEQRSDFSDVRMAITQLEANHVAMFYAVLLSSKAAKESFLFPPTAEHPVGMASQPRPTVPLKSTAAIVSATIKRQLDGSDPSVQARRRYPNPLWPNVSVMHNAIAMRTADEQYRSEYRTTMNRLASFDLEAMLSDVDPVGTMYGTFDTAFYAVLERGPPWIACEHLLYSWGDTYLFQLGEEDRKKVLSEYNTLMGHISELRGDHAFVDEVMKTGGPGGSKIRDREVGLARVAVVGLEMCLRREHLKQFYCVTLPQLLSPSPATALQVIGEDVPYDEHFMKTVASRARAQYEQEILEMDDDPDVGRRKLKRRKRTEMGLRGKQVVVLRQEINRQLLKCSVDRVRGVLEAVNAMVVRLLGGSIEEDPTSNRVNTKLNILSEFIHTVMVRTVSTRQDDTIVYQIPEPVLSQAVDTLGCRLRDWQTSHLSDIANTAEAIIQQHRHALFKAEQRVLLLEKIRELDRKALLRRVHSKVTDEKYALIFQRNSLEKDNNELQDRIKNLETIVRAKVKAEYDQQITDLKNEILVIQGQFKDHKKKLYREMQINLEEIKRQAMMSIGKSEIAPLHMKRQALRIAINDEEMNKLKEQNAELQMTVTKLKLWHDMKMINIVGHYEKKVATLEREKEEASSKYWGDKKLVEDKEELMRQQLHATQKSLSATEMEVEQLLRDIELQERKKKHLVAWKVAHSKQLEELTRKAKKYEKYEKHDIDKLLMDLEHEKEKAKLSSQEAPKSSVGGVSGGARSREVARLKEQLKREKRLKVKAFSKLDQMREDQETVTDEMIWQKKYFECATELQRTLRDLQCYKDHIEVLGVSHPTLPSRPDSGGSGARLDSDLPDITRTPESSSPAPPRVSSAPTSAARPHTASPSVPVRPSTGIPHASRFR